MNNVTELAPCPFCGSKDGPGIWANHRVVCGGCDAEGPSLHDALEANLSAWNTRAAQGRAPLTETQVQALRSATPGGDWFDEEQAAIFERGIRAAERAHGIAPAGGIGDTLK